MSTLSNEVKRMKIRTRNLRTAGLITSGVLFLLGIFSVAFVDTNIYYKLAITQFVIVIAVTVYTDLKHGPVTVSQALDYNDKQYEEAIKDKKPLAVFAYGAAIPAVVIGIVTVAIMTVSVWFR